MYSMYSKYYDLINNHYHFWFPFIDKHLENFNTKVKLIEYECGTGLVLEHYKGRFEIEGIDISEGMLNQAKSKLPGVIFYQQDMVHFQKANSYDIALCLFDSINHITDFYDWKTFIQNVFLNLRKNGVFIVDVNTTRRLESITKRPPLFKEFDSNYFYMKLHKKQEKNFVFDVRILKNNGNGIFHEERELIEETTEDGSVIYKILNDIFPDIDVFNERKEKIDEQLFLENEEYRWFFICKKR